MKLVFRILLCFLVFTVQQLCALSVSAVNQFAGIDQWQARQVFLPNQSGPATLQWFLSDRMGSVQAVTDANGGVLESYSYSAFGQRTILTTSSSLQTSNTLGFTGREHDSETGLTYYRARYMDPGLGRFISEDPIGFGSGDFSRNRYATNSPLMWLDNSGNNPELEYSELSKKDNATGALQVPRVSTEEIEDLTEEYAQKYQAKFEKYECHHIVPKYLGGTNAEANLVFINAAYHQLITNAIRFGGAPFGGSAGLSADRIKEILEKVYEELPLPNTPCE